MKKIMNVLQGVLITIGILAILLFLIPWVIGIKPFVVLSGSMHPELPVGTVAYTNSHIKPEEVKVGDIIVYKMDKQHVAHRVVEISGDNTFTTKGDANETEDLTPVKFENHTGNVVFSIPYMGYLLQLIQTSTGKFILLALVGLNIVFFIFSKDDNETKVSEGENK